MANLKPITTTLLKRVKKFIQQLEPVQSVVEDQEHSKIQPNVVTYFDPKSVLSEEKWTIRTNLMFALSQEGKKKFLVNSSINTEVQ